MNSLPQSPDILYFLSDLENRVERRYYHVVIPFAARTPINFDSLKPWEILSFVQTTFQSVLAALPPPLQGVVSGPGRLSTMLCIVGERPRMGKIFSMQLAHHNSPAFNKDDVHPFYLFRPSVDMWTSSGVWCDAPVQLMATVGEEQMILAFSFYMPLFGDEARNMFLRYFNDRFADGPAAHSHHSSSPAAHPHHSPSPAAHPHHSSSPAAAPFGVEVQADEARVNTEMALAHDIYALSLDSRFDTYGHWAAEHCHAKLLLAGDEMELLASGLGTEFPDTILGYSKVQIAAAALTWVAVTETRAQLHESMRELLSRHGTARIDLSVSSHHVCEESDYDASQLRMRWPGNANCPVITKLCGLSFCSWPQTGVNEETLRCAMHKIAENMRSFDKSVVENLARRGMNLPYSESLFSYHQGLNSPRHGFRIENWTGHDYKGMRCSFDEELYPRASLAHVRTNLLPGMACLLPQVDDEDEGKVVVLLALAQNEMEVVKNQKLGDYLPSSPT